MKWYFCINQASLATYIDHIRVAIASCRRYTDLTPVCISDAAEPELVRLLENYDAPLLVRQVRLVTEFANFNYASFHAQTAAGAYLRCEIPDIEQEDEYVLYTDCDVMFVQNYVAPQIRPKFFSCAPEMDINDWSYFNSGVMVMNVPNMRRVMPDFFRMVVARLRLYTHRYGYDQNDLNAFFWGAWDFLPVEFNWKPYWGLNPQARIVHFHGPKPVHLSELSGGPKLTQNLMPEEYKDLFSRNSEAYDLYRGLFDEMLQGGRQ